MPVFTKVAVIGAGEMGRGISRTLAQHGLEVVFQEINEQKVAEAMEAIIDNLDSEIERWGITESEKKAILSRIKGTAEDKDIKDADLIIESVDEDFETKARLLKNLNELMPAEVIFVTNTSTLSITELASKSGRAEKFVGMHFMYPAHKRPLVEIVRGLHTTDETVQKIKQLARDINKTAIEVFEYPGYVTTRMIIPYLNEAMYIVMEGVASANDVDTAMRLGYNFPVGPLQLADQLGLDELLVWMELLFAELGDVKYRPCPLLRKMVRAGHLGVKTQRGFFTYDEDGHRFM